MERVAVQTKAPACHVKQPPPPSKPYCVGITPALAKQRPQLGSESFFSGLPKATLDTHGPRPQTSLQAAAWPRKLFLWASEGDVRHPRAPHSNAPRQPAGLPRPLCGLSEAGPRPQTFLQAAAWPRKLFLWASEGDVRHPRAPPSNAPRQPAGLPRPLCGLSEACLFSSPTGPGRKRSCRPQLSPESFFYGLPKATLDTHGPALKGSSAAGRPAAASLWPVRSLPLLFAHGPRPQTFLQAAAWPRKLFLRTSEGDVRHPRAPPSNAPRQPAGLPRPSLWPVRSLPLLFAHGPGRKRSCRPQLGPESFFYGLPKATLDTHGPRPQTLLGSRQACRGLSVACPKPASSLRPRAPAANVPAGRSLAQKAFSMGFRRRR